MLRVAEIALEVFGAPSYSELDEVLELLAAECKRRGWDVGARSIIGPRTIENPDQGTRTT